MNDYTVTRNRVSGAWQVSGFDASGQLVCLSFLGYTRREAVRKWRQEVTLRDLLAGAWPVD